MSRLYNVERFKFRRLSSSKRLSFSFSILYDFVFILFFLMLEVETVAAVRGNKKKHRGEELRRFIAIIIDM